MTTLYHASNELSKERVEFPEMSNEWLDFIAACRMGIPHGYDVVEGPMADDTVFNYVQGFTDGRISRAAFWNSPSSTIPPARSAFTPPARSQR